MVRCGSCLQENRDGATTFRRCGSQIRETRVRPPGLSAGVAAATSPPARVEAPSGVPTRVPPGRRAPGTPVNVRGRLVSVLPNGQDDDDEFLSRRHAQVTILQGRPVLQDLGSSNGTTSRLRAPQVLVPGDMIRLGDQLLRFELS
jgi:hypothetical protein